MIKITKTATNSRATQTFYVLRRHRMPIDIISEDNTVVLVLI